MYSTQKKQDLFLERRQTFEILPRLHTRIWFPVEDYCISIIRVPVHRQIITLMCGMINKTLFYEYFAALRTTLKYGYCPKFVISFFIFGMKKKAEPFFQTFCYIKKMEHGPEPEPTPVRCTNFLKWWWFEFLSMSQSQDAGRQFIFWGNIVLHRSICNNFQGIWLHYYCSSICDCRMTFTPTVHHTI